MRYFSCDSHVVEAREVFEGLEDRFGARAPRIERDFKGRRGDWLVLPDMFPIPGGRPGIAGHRLDEPATDELIVAARDMKGTLRFVVTSATGQPLRSYRTDAVQGVTDLAQLAPGADSPMLGVLIGQPSEYVRITLAP